jgi:hypothetical protein
MTVVGILVVAYVLLTLVSYVPGFDRPLASRRARLQAALATRS